MPRGFSQVYVHLVWGTWSRRKLITPEVQARLYPALLGIGRGLGAQVRAIGGVEDHVHLVVEIPSTLSVADLARRLKGASAHLLNHEPPALHRFRWQVGYGAFSVSPRHLPAVEAYVRDQARRHGCGRINLSLERTEPPPQSAEPTSRRPSPRL